jgi:hypothetical protein
MFDDEQAAFREGPSRPVLADLTNEVSDSAKGCFCPRAPMRGSIPENQPDPIMSSEHQSSEEYLQGMPAMTEEQLRLLRGIMQVARAAVRGNDGERGERTIAALVEKAKGTPLEEAMQVVLSSRGMAPGA